MDRLEGVLNFVCPKSIIVYGQKRVAASADLDDTRGTAANAEAATAAA
jgi:hypothetical protein